MIVEAKILDLLGEHFSTAKGGMIQEFLIQTKDGTKEVAKIHAGADSIPALLALKADQVVKVKLPENFFFLQS